MDDAKAFCAVGRCDRWFETPEFRREAGQSLIRTLSPALLGWHLPDDFTQRPPGEREAIVDWLAVTFETPQATRRLYRRNGASNPFRMAQLVSTRTVMPRQTDGGQADAGDTVPDRIRAALDDFIAFKTAPMTPRQMCRQTVWRASTVRLQLEKLASLLGFLVARSPPARIGLGLDPDSLSLGHLIFPAVWDAYLRALTRSRGYPSTAETGAIALLSVLTHPLYGWLTQSDHLAEELSPLAGLVSQEDIDEARAKWKPACKRCHDFAVTRKRDIDRLLKRRPRDANPLAVVLSQDRPLDEYRKIADAVWTSIERAEPHPWDLARRYQFYIMLRLALHTGFRQRTLRELLCAWSDSARTPLPVLERREQGEIFWDAASHSWNILAPATAFKNAESVVFRHGAYETALPDIEQFNARLNHFLDHHRPNLLLGRRDPGTLFIAPGRHTRAAFSMVAYYNFWRDGIAYHGIHNPWTGRGAIPGLKRHGPHGLRSVIVTHILKQTGSFELAAFAIQDRPATVEEHYGHLRPEERGRLVANLLHSVWTP